MASEVLPVVKKTPVLAGVNGTVPFGVMPHFVRQIKDIGFAGVQNFPTFGLIDGVFHANLEETGTSHGLEVAMIRTEHDMDLVTSPYVLDEERATDMARAGADILVPHMRLTTSGTIGAQTAMTLEEAAKKVQSLADFARRVNPDMLCLCHGGPIANPEDAQYVLAARPQGTPGTPRTARSARPTRPQPRNPATPTPKAPTEQERLPSTHASTGRWNEAKRGRDQPMLSASILKPMISPTSVTVPVTVTSCPIVKLLTVACWSSSILIVTPVMNANSSVPVSEK